MVNQRYDKPVSLLKGIAKLAHDHRMDKITPEFFKLQRANDVPELNRLKRLPFVVGDRVQAIRGPDAGKIGIIRSVYKNGNSFIVEGLGGTQKTVMPRQIWFQGQTRPVIGFPKMMKLDDLQLVTKMLHEDGTEEDVAVHSITFRGVAYDKDTNSFRPIRRAAHDESIIIPYPPPSEPLEKSQEAYATSPEVADQKTYFPSSLVKPSIPMDANTQFRNIHSKYKRDRYTRTVSEEDLEARKQQTREMAIVPETKDLLEKLATLPKRRKTPFTEEIEQFISDEILKGLYKQKKRLEEAFKDYT